MAVDLDLRGKCNDKQLNEIIEFTKPAVDITTPPQPEIRRKNSQAPREAQQINFYPSAQEEDQKLPIGKPPKGDFKNPFEAGSPPRSVKDVLSILANIDFENCIKERKLNP